MLILIFYWLLLRPRVRELQLVSYSFGKFRVALQKNAPLFSSVFYPCQSVAWDFSWTPDLSGLLGSEASAMPAGPASRITAVWYSSR